MNNKVNDLLYSSFARATRPREDLRLAQSCRDFESVFLTTLWRNMAKNAGMEIGAWDVLLAQSMGKAWAESGGIGLAKVLYEQLSKSSPSNLSGDDVDEKTFGVPE